MWRMKSIILGTIGFIAAGVMGLPGSASAVGQAGTTLTASKTAEGYCVTTNIYDWSLNKNTDVTSIEVSRGESAMVSYTLNAIKSLTSTSTVCGVSGTITVTNGGSFATDNLLINDIVQTKVGSGQFQNYTSNPVNLSSNPVLDPLETGVYNYNFTFTPVSGALYRNVADVTITNHSGWLPGGNNCSGTSPCAFGPNPKADFSLPAEPTIVDYDGVSSIADVLTCPVGFTCQLSDIGPWSLEGSQTISYAATITNVSATCDSYYSLNNTATLTEGDSAQTRTASASVGIYTKICQTGVTRTIGYWKTHAGFTGNNADRVSQYLPIWLGTANGTKSVLVTTPTQAVAILSNMGSNGIDKLMAQLLATKLNIASGSNGASVSTVIAQANTFLTTYNSSSWGSLSRTMKTTVLSWMTALDAFNNSGETV